MLEEFRFLDGQANDALAAATCPSLGQELEGGDKQCPLESVSLAVYPRLGFTVQKAHRELDSRGLGLNMQARCWPSRTTNGPSPAAIWAWKSSPPPQHAHVVQALEAKLPAAAAHLDQARDDILAFTAFPREVWRQIWSNNPLSVNRLSGDTMVPAA